MKKTRKIWIVVFSIFLISACAILIWFLIPRQFPKTKPENIAEIEAFDGNGGNTIVITDKEDIVYIVEELGNTNYQIEKPALGFGTSFQLSFKNENGEILETLVVQSENQIKKRIILLSNGNPDGVRRAL